MTKWVEKNQNDQRRKEVSNSASCLRKIDGNAARHGRQRQTRFPPYLCSSQRHFLRQFRILTRTNSQSEQNTDRENGIIIASCVRYMKNLPT